jgi:hypothetical protein
MKLARSIGGYWLKNRDSELFQNKKRDSRDAGFSKLDLVITGWDYISMYLERPADKR